MAAQEAAAPTAEPGPPPACAQCGSVGLMTGVSLNTVNGAAVVLQLRDGTRAVPTATICGQCGDVRIRADPQMIYRAFGQNG